ncbi:hypothetical protein FOA43_001734 [Brettanomyces nanus]|uniref:Uncharacterized protein n=1 Tax=Eeniella nana TaxID=13502 RepID=A0A875S251_EENNA|nr:uncharacterized protein FOA43_001734 [Brettanomyces nanus]QPG74405.1 hypothetical protein FOA43_001734 [Brettanomyces nanus]
MSAEPDYYSEDIPPPEDESEILECEPIVTEKEKTNGLIKRIEDEGVSEKNIEAIDDTEVVTIESRRAFENQLIRSIENIDFARNRGYHVESKKSTRAETLIRIRNEIRELEMSDGEGDKESETELKELKKRVEKLSLGKNKIIETWKEALKGRSIDEREEEVNGEREIEPKESDLENIGELDLRLKELEEKVGIGDYDDGLTLQDAVNDLYRRVNLTMRDGIGLEETRKEFGALSENLEEYLKRSRQLEEREKAEIVPLTDQKIIRVYERLRSMPELDKVVPLMVKRLQATNKLVLEASGSMDGKEN